jgi:tetratricopeptide (TPR) repeat protein
MRSGVDNFLLLILLLIPCVSPADELADALSRESSGNRLQAELMYREWLETSDGDPRFPEVLLHTASLYENPDESLNLMRRYLSRLDPENRFRVLARMAGLESSLGYLDSAALHFQMASESGGREADRWRYESLSLYFLMGEFSEVRTDALALSRESSLSGIRDRSASLAALCLAYSGDISDALKEIDAYISHNAPVESPLLWFTRYKIASLDGNTEVMKQSFEELMRDFPSTIPAYIADSKLSEWDSPSLYLFLPDSSSGKSVQVGAFGSRDAASALRVELENDGFIAWIEKSGRLWRVYVNDPAGDALSRLADQGYESLF